VLPEGKAPKRAGVLVLTGDKVTVKPAPDAGVMLDGKPVGERVLRDDMSETTDVLKIGEVSFYVIKRGERFGVRIKDPNGPVRAHFKGLEYFAADPKWRVTATFVAYDAPRKVRFPTCWRLDTMEAPGQVKFTVDGREYTLEPVVEDPKDPSLWFIFKDGRVRRKPTAAAGSSIPACPRAARSWWISTRPTTPRARSRRTPHARFPPSRTGCRSGSRRGEGVRGWARQPLTFWFDTPPSRV
jgi:hypothetical protein